MENLKKCEKNSIKIRYNHIKLHANCIYKSTLQLIQNKIILSKYFQKEWFYIKGIIRSIINR